MLFTNASAFAALLISIPGVIRGKGRHTTRVLPGSVDPVTGKRRMRAQMYSPKETVTAENNVGWHAIQQVGQPVLRGAIELTINVTVAIPTSWSKRKQETARAGNLRPVGKPDASNVTKLIEDALNKIVWHDDSQIVDLHFHKHYGDAPGALLKVRQV